MRINLICLLLVCFSAGLCAADKDAVSVEMNKHEKAFQKLLKGATLKGSFTMKGKHQQEGLAEELYEIADLEKSANGKWRFQVRIKYANTDVTVPLFLDVKWAEETPMIYIDKLMVPGIGAYSSRVIFHENKYAGTWSGVGYGGHLFGEVTRAPKKAAPSNESHEKTEVKETPEQKP